MWLIVVYIELIKNIEFDSQTLTPLEKVNASKTDFWSNESLGKKLNFVLFVLAHPPSVAIWAQLEPRLARKMSKIFVLYANKTKFYFFPEGPLCRSRKSKTLANFYDW